MRIWVNDFKSVENALRQSCERESPYRFESGDIWKECAKLERRLQDKFSKGKYRVGYWAVLVSKPEKKAVKGHPVVRDSVVVRKVSDTNEAWAITGIESFRTDDDFELEPILIEPGKKTVQRVSKETVLAELQEAVRKRDEAEGVYLTSKSTYEAALREVHSLQHEFNTHLGLLRPSSL